jgi:sugar phosphate isomerase/epimerase
MRFGVSGDLFPRDMREFTAGHAARTRELGFTGIFTRFGANDPHTVSAAECHRVRDTLADHGLAMYQATGYWQPLIHPDELARREASRTLRAALRVAKELGARGIDTGPGSLSPNGPWAPHPGNWTPDARRQLVRTLKECAPAAEDLGVFLSLEGHLLVTLSSAEVVRDVLDEVGSPFVRSDLDPVNWIGLGEIYDTTSAIERMFDVLGERVVSGHAKDVVIEDRLVVHIDQRPAGQGLLDFPTYLRRMEALNPDYPVIVEGATVDELPAVKAFLDSTAEGLGITVY